MTKNRVPRPWDVLELSDGPSERLTYEGWLKLYEGDVAKVEHELCFRSDVVELVHASADRFPARLAVARRVPSTLRPTGQRKLPLHETQLWVPRWT